MKFPYPRHLDIDSDEEGKTKDERERLLTAYNQAVVKEWNANRVRQGLPQRVV
jgi:hypothetical protein